MSSYEVLVIILSILLGLFLTLSIVVAVLVIKLIKKIHAIADKASRAVNSVEDITEAIRNATSSSIIGGLGTKLWKKFYNSQTKKR